MTSVSASLTVPAKAEDTCTLSPDKGRPADLDESANTSVESESTDTSRSSTDGSSGKVSSSSNGNGDSDSDTEYEKPPHSYIALISMALLDSKDKKCLLGEIYEYTMTKFPFYRYTPDKAWRNSIRHNLSLNECFIKAGRADNGKGNYWAIHPACVEDFAKGDFRRRQARRRARRSQHPDIRQTGQRQNLAYVEMTSTPGTYGMSSTRVARNYPSPQYYPYVSQPCYTEDPYAAYTTLPMTTPTTQAYHPAYTSPPCAYSTPTMPYTSSPPTTPHTSPDYTATYSLTVTGKVNTPYMSQRSSYRPTASTPYGAPYGRPSHQELSPPDVVNPLSLSPLPYNTTTTSPQYYKSSPPHTTSPQYYRSPSDVSSVSPCHTTNPGSGLESPNSLGFALQGVKDLAALREVLGSLASLSN